MKNFLLITILTATFLAFNAYSNEMKKTEFIKSTLTTSEDIAKLEAITGKDLPEWYVERYMQLSGLKRAELKGHEIDDNSHVDFTAVFEGGGADGDHITHFMSLEQIEQAWPYIDYLEDDVDNFEISSSFVQWEYLFPLAGTGDGTIYVAIGGDHNRKVYEADNGDYGIGLVSNDIDDFVTSLGIKVKTE